MNTVSGSNPVTQKQESEATGGTGLPKLEKRPGNAFPIFDSPYNWLIGRLHEQAGVQVFLIM